MTTSAFLRKECYAAKDKRTAGSRVRENEKKNYPNKLVNK